VAQARHVFHARRLVEPALVRGLAGQLRKDEVARLRRSVALESEARARNDRRATIRLSGEFHLQLAELGQNPYLVRCLRELCSLTCLVIALYDAPGMPACPYHEHETLIDAIERGDGETAAALMVEHLTHVEGTLRLEMPEDEEVDLREVFA